MACARLIFGHILSNKKKKTCLGDFHRCASQFALGKPQKKVHPLVVRPLIGGGGGGKDRTTKEKELF